MSKTDPELARAREQISGAPTKQTKEGINTLNITEPLRFVQQALRILQETWAKSEKLGTSAEDTQTRAKGATESLARTSTSHSQAVDKAAQTVDGLQTEGRWTQRYLNDLSGYLVEAIDGLGIVAAALSTAEVLRVNASMAAGHAEGHQRTALREIKAAGK